MSKLSSTDSGATILSKLNNTIVTVGTQTGADYVCDGTADDVQIQAAIDAVGALGGGTVMVRAGTYNTTSSIHMHDYVILQGEGDITVIKSVASMSAVIYNAYTSTISGAIIRDIKLDANSQTTTSCIQIYKYNHLLIENVYCANAKGAWGVLCGYYSTDEDTDKSYYLTMRDVTIDGTTDTTLEPAIIVNTNFITIDNALFINNQAGTLSSMLAIYYLNKYVSITNCGFYNSLNQYSSLDITASSFVSISNNKFIDTSSTGRKHITLRNVNNVNICNNNFKFTDTANGSGIIFLDWASTIDGHTNPCVDSYGVVIDGNTFVNGYTLINLTSNGTDNSLSQDNIIISNNYIENVVYSGLSVGHATRITGTITNIIVKGNFITGRSSGARLINMIGNSSYAISNVLVDSNILDCSGGAGNESAVFGDYVTYSQIQNNRLVHLGTGNTVVLTNDDYIMIQNNYLSKAVSTAGAHNTVANNNI
jgi:hypothetical protein